MERRPRPSTLVIAALVIASTTWLIWTERGTFRSSSTAGAPAAEGKVRYAILDQRELEVGQLEVDRHAESRADDAGFTTKVNASVRLDLLGATRELELRGTFWLADDQQRAEIAAQAVSDGRNLDLDATVRDGKLEGTLSTGGELIPVSFPLPADALMASALGSPLDFPDLEPGQRVSVAGFDPMTLSAGRAQLELIGPETLTILGVAHPARLVELRQGPITTRLHLDSQGQLLRAETPFGLILEWRPAGAEPATADAEPAAAQIVSLAMVTPKAGSQPPHRGATRLRLRIDRAGTSPPTSTRQQTLADGSFELLAEAPLAERQETQPLPDSVRDLLAAEVLVQSDHPQIRATALGIVADLDDPWARATALGRWVFDELEKSPTASVPSAIEVLQSKSGDCNEHTVLYAALARAVGIPTRIAIGLVWSDTHQAFAYHAWPEVWIADRFIALDPTLGEDVADATHLVLLYGGLERWFSLAGWIGSIDIDVVEVE